MVSRRLGAIAIAIAVAMTTAGCSTGASVLSLPKPGHSVVIHGVLNMPIPKGVTVSGPIWPCIYKGALSGPKRCDVPTEYPHGAPQCVVRNRGPVSVTATLVREARGNAYWLITQLDGQAC